MNNQATALLGLLTETSLHAGAGSAVGGVDLPIQREGHNGWPCVFGSAVKGALRDKAEGVFGKDHCDVLALFGPDTLHAADNAGALAVGDARLLLLPVRSLTGAFKWVTCAEALARLQRDAKRMGLEADFSFEAPKVASDTQAWVCAGSGDLFLEEYRYTLNAAANIADCCAAIARLMAREGVEEELKRRLVIVSDDMYAHLTQTAVPINAHIALDADTKTVRKGMLWYEETLPPETLLYVPLAANKSRKKDHEMEAGAVMSNVTGLFSAKPYLQLGGNETVGMGWCAVKALEGA
ncbi:MAG: type III-B CRISPR module RAMP protein Cmr4 [Sulfuricellaceae bacterium]